MMMNGSYPARLGIEAPLEVKNWRPLGKHVEGLRSFLIGVSRWSWRVSAYSGLLRDEYPQFSLEDGSLGSAPAVTDVLGGQIPMASVDLTSAHEHIKAGTLAALGVTSARSEERRVGKECRSRWSPYH